MSRPQVARARQLVRRGLPWIWPAGVASFRLGLDTTTVASRELAHCGPGVELMPPVTVSGAAHVWIGGWATVMEHVELEAGPGVDGEPSVVIGERALLGRFVTIKARNRVHLGADAATSDFVTIVDYWDTPPGAALPPFPDGPVTVGAGAFLGAGSVILPGVTIGEGAYVAEAAVVSADVEAHTVVAGNPAVPVRGMDR